MVYRVENLCKVINDIRKRHGSDRNKTSRILRALSGVKKMFHKESQQSIRNIVKKNNKSHHKEIYQGGPWTNVLCCTVETFNYWSPEADQIGERSQNLFVELDDVPQNWSGYSLMRIFQFEAVEPNLASWHLRPCCSRDEKYLTTSKFLSYWWF